MALFCNTKKIKLLRLNGFTVSFHQRLVFGTYMYLNNRNRPTAMIKAPYQRQRMKFAIEDKQVISILDWTFQIQT